MYRKHPRDGGRFFLIFSDWQHGRDGRIARFWLNSGGLDYSGRDATRYSERNVSAEIGELAGRATLIKLGAVRPHSILLRGVPPFIERGGAYRLNGRITRGLFRDRNQKSASRRTRIAR